MRFGGGNAATMLWLPSERGFAAAHRVSWREHSPGSATRSGWRICTQLFRAARAETASRSFHSMMSSRSIDAAVASSRSEWCWSAVHVVRKRR